MKCRLGSKTLLQTALLLTGKHVANCPESYGERSSPRAASAASKTIRPLTWLGSTALLASTAVAAMLLGTAAQAQDATWLASPATADFDAAANWTPATVPTGTAFFGTSSTTNLSFSANTTIGGWTFNAGASNYTFTNGTHLVFDGAGIVINGGSATITNNLAMFFINSSSAGSATINNLGTMTFFGGSATAGSATIENNAQLAFEFASAGSATITNNAMLLFTNSGTGGTARLINAAAGTIDLSASDGITAGSIEGAGTISLGSKNLAVGGNDLSTTFSGVVQDGGIVGGTGGSLTKTGAGTLTLAGANTYTGATTVNGGTLAVNGSIASSVLTTVNAGGTLAGTGTLGNTTITSGGTLAAGNGTAGSSVTVSGSLAFQSGAIYMVQVNPATSSFTHVTGTATLGGASVQATYANGSYVAKQYTIVTAGSVSGTFGSVVDSNPPVNLHSTLSYDATHAYLNLVLNFVPPGGGLTGNQNGVGNAIVGYFNTNGGIPLVYSGLTPAGLTQASGETATGSQQSTFNAMNQFMGVMTDPFMAGRDGAANAPGAAPGFADEQALEYAAKKRNPNDALAAIYAKAPPVAPFQQRWSVWAAGFGGSQTTDGNIATGSNTATSRVYGTAIGADYRFSPFTIAGFSLAGGGTNFSVANNGTGRSDLFQAGAFIRHNVGAAYLSGALAYGWQDITTDRTVTIAGVDRLRARFNANAWSGRVEGGYRFVAPVIGGVGFTPYAAGQFTTFELPAYAEGVISGANTFALAYSAKSVTSTRSELGFRTDKSFAVTDAILTLRGRVAWAHDFNSDRSASATFQTLSGASFVVNGAAQASDAALTTASAEMKWTNGWAVAGTFEGEFSDVTRSFAGKGVVRYAW
jgi:autotransporter-associated beta strand protein